jgi:hypothetical protein
MLFENNSVDIIKNSKIKLATIEKINPGIFTTLICKFHIFEK